MSQTNFTNCGGSYETAWYLLQRFLRAMVNDSRTLLSGTVEADETFIGGPVKGKQGRGSTKGANKSLVLGMVEVFSSLKTWLVGTHHGVDPKYLQVYLDEFVFRFNRRHIPMAAFQTLLGISSAKKHHSMSQLRRPETTG